MKKLNILIFTIAASLAAFSAHAVTANIYGHDTVRLVEQSAVPVNVTGTTVETTVANLVIPGNSIAAHGSLRVTLLMSTPNNVNNKTIKVRLGGALINSIVSTNATTLNWEIALANRGSSNSQVMQASTTTFGLSTGVVAVTAIDTSKDQPLLITCQLAVGSDNCQLERYSVEILNP